MAQEDTSFFLLIIVSVVGLVIYKNIDAVLITAKALLVELVLFLLVIGYGVLLVYGVLRIRHKPPEDMPRIVEAQQEIVEHEPKPKPVPKAAPPEEPPIILDDNVYLADRLTDREINHLLSTGFQEDYFVAIGKIKQEKYYVRKNSIEGPEHVFVAEEITRLLRERNVPFERAYTVGPDILFTDKEGRQIVIEVETGHSYRINKLTFQEKFKKLAEEYPGRVYIVLTNAKYKQRYQNTLPNIPIMVRSEVPSFLPSLI